MKYAVEKDGFVWKGKTYKKGETIEMTDAEVNTVKASKVTDPVHHETTPKKADR
jgi:hypothetical protein